MYESANPVTWLATDLHTNKKRGRSRLGTIQISCEEVAPCALGYDRAAY
jgi:hypothetical protein